MSTDDSIRHASAAIAFLAVAALILGAPPAHAAACDVSYTGPANGSWQAAANWSGAALPSASQSVCIPAGAGTLRVPAGFTAKAATVTARSGVAIAATGALALSDPTSSATHASTFSGLSVQGTLSSAGSWISIAGDAAVDGQIAGPNSYVTLFSGTLSGTGTIEPSFNNVGGTVAPGGTGAVGTLTFGAQYAQQPAGTIALDLASDTAFDQILPEHGNAFIAGAITVGLLGAYAPAVGTIWVFLSGSPGVQQLDWTVSPSEFVPTTIGGAAQLRLGAPPARGPQPPTVEAAAGDGQATVTVHAPADHGSENTQGYAVTVEPGDLHRYMTDPGQVVVAGLANGTTYTVTATVTTSIATSAPSAAVRVTPGAPVVTLVEPPPAAILAPPPPGPAIVPEPKGVLIIATRRDADAVVRRIKAPARRARPRTINLRLGADFTFGLDSATLTAGGKAVLAKLGARLRTVKVLSARIAGNASYEGRPELDAYNKALSGQRAAAAAKALRASLGHAKVSQLANGVTKPVQTNATAAGRAANRNVQLTFVIVRKGRGATAA